MVLFPLTLRISAHPPLDVAMDVGFRLARPDSLSLCESYADERSLFPP